MHNSDREIKRPGVIRFPWYWGLWYVARRWLVKLRLLKPLPPPKVYELPGIAICNPLGAKVLTNADRPEV